MTNSNLGKSYLLLFVTCCDPKAANQHFFAILTTPVSFKALQGAFPCDLAYKIWSQKYGPWGYQMVTTAWTYCI